MTLERIREAWDRAAQENAKAFILTDRPSPAEFYRRGELDVAQQPMPEHRGRALDFGCGIGRLTVPLARRFRRVDGVDVSEEMIHRARQAAVKATRAEFHVNDRPDLALFEDATFDFIVSLITLQHLPSHLQRCYVTEFVRVLRPGGVAVFQIPEGEGRTQDPDYALSMYGTPRARVQGWVRRAGGRSRTREDSYTGGDYFRDWLYTVRRA